MLGSIDKPIINNLILNEPKEISSAKNLLETTNKKWNPFVKKVEDNKDIHDNSMKMVENEKNISTPKRERTKSLFEAGKKLNFEESNHLDHKKENIIKSQGTKMLIVYSKKIVFLYYFFQIVIYFLQSTKILNLCNSSKII